jgi:hypothetical protein
VFTPGTLCRSKDAIIKCENDSSGRVCHVVAVLPEHRWRFPQIPEYKIELPAMPVTAFRRLDELDVLSTGTESPLEPRAREVLI